MAYSHIRISNLHQVEEFVRLERRIIHIIRKIYIYFLSHNLIFRKLMIRNIDDSL